ncbi:hypothetical protein [Fimbriimonas ginsengisoli]|uniref:Uncharacterized protein n=1 Tax=Fimbriimonas ginsengisoli Gsoil 348 TaxID=661478 RepID=A0A068NM30_FIMGI|nr:hypothetical protein [Fimbriimonas ginsengisoli]AIE84526.1 hypothetical protein OP10G_1158 [Fimbriimonas ginsengisoli Gsoil 348]
MSKMWHPSPLEVKCLSHLDSAAGWKILGRERPPETDLLPWSPFQRIFLINFVQFALVLTLVFFLVENASGVGFGEIREDLPYGLGGVVVLASLLGAYVTYLYRRSWNKRARSLMPASE